MKIAFYSDNFYPELSGITDTIVTTGKELKKRGHEIVYVGPYYAPADYAKANRQYPERPEDDQIEGMPIVRLRSIPLRPSPTGQSRFAIPSGRTLEYMRTFKPDIIHTQSPYSLGWEARKVAVGLGVPLVGTNHTAIEDFFPPFTRALMRRWDARYYNSCDFVSAPYERLLGRMREVGFKKPGHAVPNPADLHEFLPATAEEKIADREAFGLQGPVILYAGRLGVEKRVDVMVRAMPILLKEFPTLTLVATGHGAARTGLDKLVQKLGVAKQVRFTGFLSRAALTHAYKTADLFGMTSTSDSQSLALMQGYASGLPAVCAAARGLPDYVPADCGFLIEPNNPADFAAKAAQLLRDEPLRARMGVAAIDYSKNFAPEKIAQQWEEIYSEALKKTP